MSFNAPCIVGFDSWNAALCSSSLAKSLYKYKFEIVGIIKVFLMNLTQIVAFRAVMTSSSLSQAARKLGRTQPAISLSIKTLEDELGMKLFERRARQLVPVPEASYLLAESDEILRRLSSVSRTMRSFAEGTAGDLKISTFPGVSAFLFPRFAAGFLGDRDDVRLTLTSRSSEQITELARSQSIDFGFCDAPEISPQQTAQLSPEIVTGRSFVALPKTHPLADQKSINVQDMAGNSFGALQAAHPHQRHLRNLFKSKAVDYAVVVESQTFTPLLQFVKNGRCIAIVDPLTVVNEIAVPTTEGSVVFRPFDEKLRYEYAVLSPLHRPLSQLAARVKNGWREEVVKLLSGIGAEPAWEENQASV